MQKPTQACVYAQTYAGLLGFHLHTLNHLHRHFQFFNLLNNLEGF